MPCMRSCVSGSRLHLMHCLPQSIPFGISLRLDNRLHKVFACTTGLGSYVAYSDSAVCCALKEPSDEELEGNLSDGINQRDPFFILNLMEERGVQADCCTYAALLDACLFYGLEVDTRRIHGKILKLGFDVESLLCDRLMDSYTFFGNFDDAVNVFDDRPHRTVASWSKMILGFLQRNEHSRVLTLFSRMTRECEGSDPAVFASALKACSGNHVGMRIIKQIHGKIIQRGFAADSVVANPLIDLYSKKGHVESAGLVFENLPSKDNISWVAMLSGFSQNGMGEAAVNLYFQMHRLGVMPTPYVLSSVVSACAKCKLFGLGYQIHSQVLKWGFCSATFVGNALITFYSRCGSMRLADQVLGEMHHHDRVTYNSLISAHTLHGNCKTAVYMFHKMQSAGLEPDSVTLASLLCACASIGDVKKGQQLHSYLLKVGLLAEYIIEGSLLDLYVKCGDVETAHEFFNTTDRGNVVLWNVMLVAYGQMGSLRDSFDLFSEMLAGGIMPNEYTYPSILRTCTYTGAFDLGEQIHALTVKSGLDLNVYVSSVLIDLYSKFGKLKSAREILDSLTEEDVVSWTAMIAGYAQHEYCMEALVTFEEMQSHGIRADNIGLASALSACAGIKAIAQGLQIHAQAWTSGYSKDISIGNALVNLYAKCGRIAEAYCAFDNMVLKDEVSWNGLISGFAQSGHCEEALKVFAKMDQAGVRATEFTYGSALSASANMAEVKQGQQIHSRMIKNGFDSEMEVSNAMISLYAKCGIISDAKAQFSLMSERNEVSWNAMITGYSQHGCGREALELFKQMEEDELKPSHVTFIGVLAACSHVGLVSEGMNYFNSISKVHGILPRPDHYASMVDILGRAGQLDRAKQFIEDMPIQPDAMVWRTLLSACTVHKNMELGEVAAQRLLELEPQDSATYVLLSNIYAVSRKWGSRDRMRQVMKDRGVRKEPGRSWIEVKNEIHAFFVGDRLHPLADVIYKYIEDLNEKAGALGYKPDRNCLLHEAEQEQGQSAHVHSEKLAVAFGLVSLPSEIPIRVIKNLRVCNDCHNWMKFISTIAGRFIVLRDTYRFHHFEGGSCTCGDYW